MLPMVIIRWLPLDKDDNQTETNITTANSKDRTPDPQLPACFPKCS